MSANGRYPIGQQDFSKLRESDSLYVDKTVKKIVSLVILLMLIVGNACTRTSVTRQGEEKNPYAETQDPTMTNAEKGDADGFIGKHGYVDLGLPSGLKWATCNVGASSPGDFGDYFAWGETSVKPSYYYDDCLTYHKDKSQLLRAGVIDSLGNLMMAYDAARINWGENWRMPTRQEWQELIDCCKWKYTKRDGRYVFKVTGPNGHSIFFPLAGCRSKDTLLYVGESGRFHSSTAFNWVGIIHQEVYDDNYGGGAGFTVRPVSGEKKLVTESEKISENNSIDDWQEYDFAYIDQHATFPGGYDAMLEWIYKEVTYPVEALEDNAYGRVTLEMVITETGNVGDVKVLRNRHPALDEEAVRVVKKMPKWTPALYHGKPVKDRYILPIKFKLPSDT